MSISPTTGVATLSFDVNYSLLSLLGVAEVRIPYVSDATVLSDTRVTWVTNKQLAALSVLRGGARREP